jgi:uncharacterized membrane protein
MSKKSKIIRIALAAAAISLATMPLTSTIAQAKEVKCYGVNACKAHSKCKTAKNDCKGHNACKGQGFVMMSAKRCTHKGGTTEEPTK